MMTFEELPPHLVDIVMDLEDQFIPHDEYKKFEASFRLQLGKRRAQLATGTKRRRRLKSLLLVGPAGSGKSSAVEHLLRTNEDLVLSSDPEGKCEVISMTVPTPATLKSVGIQLLNALGYPMKGERGAPYIWNRVSERFAMRQTLFLHLDEAQDLARFQTDSEHRSVLRVLVRFVVDTYHNREHRGLMGATPANEWKRRISKYGWTPPPCPDELRHAFGIKDTRKLGCHGLTVCGINYHADVLAHHHLTFGGMELPIRIDPMDMGRISCWIDDAWYSIPAICRSVHGLSFTQWEQVVFKIRQQNKAEADLSQYALDRGIKAIKSIDAERLAIMQITPLNVSASSIRNAQDETFWGLNFGALDTPVTLPDQGKPVLFDPMAPLGPSGQNQTSVPPKVDMSTPLKNNPETSETDSASGAEPLPPVWKFYDDL